ncbi:MAG: RidA family protein [Gammaproteobacteria bacterium]|nr:RidA family protein [Gammaproteobacteria bacterium]MDH3468361.1 RidA family protein [Gammaproteobacteria bacterium]
MLPRRRFHPTGHPSIGVPLQHSHGLACGEMLFIGGQADIGADAKVSRANDPAAQTHCAMQNIEKVLAAFDIDLEHLVKINTVYVGTHGEHDLVKIPSIRADYYREPGPASTGIPFPYLAYENMLIEVDAVAMV